MSFLILLIFILSLVVLQTLMRKKDEKDDPPLFVGYLPAIGHLLLLATTSTQIWQNLVTLTKTAEKQAHVLRFIMLGITVYLVTDPETAVTVANNAEKKHYLYLFFGRWLGDGLLTSPVNIWKRHRKFMKPSFNLRVLYSFMGVFNDQSKKLQGIFENEMKKGPVDILPFIKVISLESICINAFGVDPDDALEFKEKYTSAVDKMLIIVTERIRKVWYHNNIIYNYSSLKKEEDRNVKILTEMTDKVLLKKREALKIRSLDIDQTQQSDTKFKALLDLLLDLSTEGGLTDAGILNELNTIVFGGYDTTSLTLTYVMMNLGTYQDVQEKLYQEIKDVFGDSERDVDTDDLNKLVYADAVIKETLRLYPIVPIIFRELDQDIKLKDCTLRSGLGCGINIYGLNRHSMWGEDADQFRPERWLEPGGVPDVHHAFATFGVGRRSCIGKIYAMISMKTTLVHILRQFRINADITKVTLKIEVVLTPAKPCYVTLEMRNP